MSVLLTPYADKNWITARWACLEESMARSLTVISLLFQSTTHCCYRVYTKFLLTYTAMYRRNRKVLPLGITALQPQSHFHLGTPYIYPNIKFQSKMCVLTVIGHEYSINTKCTAVCWCTFVTEYPPNMLRPHIHYRVFSSVFWPHTHG